MDLEASEERVDARVATVSALILVMTALLSPSWMPPLLILAAALSAAVLLSARGRLRLASFLRLMVFPLAIASVVLVTFAYTFGSTHAYVFVLPIYVEGLQHGFIVFLRVLAATSVVLLLLQATSLTAILRALRWMRVPEVMVDLTALVYRYIFVLDEERRRMWDSVVSRLGNSRRLGYVRRVANYGLVASNLLVRSFDRSVRAFEAMQSRCYRSGRLYDLPSGLPSSRDLALGLLTLLASAALLWRWGVVW